MRLRRTRTRSRRRTTSPSSRAPDSADLEPLLIVDGDQAADQLARAIDIGTLAHAHRAVLIDLVAACDPIRLWRLLTRSRRSVAPRLVSAPPVLADLARTRRGMLDELGRR